MSFLFCLFCCLHGANAQAAKPRYDESLRDELLGSLWQKESAQTLELLERGADPNTKEESMSVLYLAIANSDVAVVRSLLKHGAEVNAVDAVYGGNALLFLMRNPLKQTALTAAERHILLLLSQYKVDVNVRDMFGKTALIAFARVGDVWATKQLLARGAHLNIADKQGMTPLMQAAKSGEVGVAATLLAAGADFDLKDKNGRTALAWLKEPIQIEHFIAGRISDLKRMNREDDAKIRQIADGHTQIRTLLLRALRMKPISKRHK